MDRISGEPDFFWKPKDEAEDKSLEPLNWMKAADIGAFDGCLLHCKKCV